MYYALCELSSYRAPCLIGQTPDNLFEWNWLDYSCKRIEAPELIEESKQLNEDIDNGTIF